MTVRWSYRKRTLGEPEATAATGQEETFATPRTRLSECFAAQGQLMGASTQEETFTAMWATGGVTQEQTSSLAVFFFSRNFVPEQNLMAMDLPVVRL